MELDAQQRRATPLTVLATRLIVLDRKREKRRGEINRERPATTSISTLQSYSQVIYDSLTSVTLLGYLMSLCSILSPC